MGFSFVVKQDLKNHGHSWITIRADRQISLPKTKLKKRPFSQTNMHAAVIYHADLRPRREHLMGDNMNSCRGCVDPDPVSERYPSLQLEAES